MARNVTVRFRDGSVLSAIDEMADIVGVSLSEFVREALRSHIEDVRVQRHFPDFLQELKERTKYKLDVIDRLSQH